MVPLTPAQLRKAKRQYNTRPHEPGCGQLGQVTRSRRLATQEVAAGGVRLRATRRRWGEDVVKVVLALFALISVADDGRDRRRALRSRRSSSSPRSRSGRSSPGTNWAPLFEPAHFGVLPLVAGTLLVSLFAALSRLPFGLGSAIYLSEYARDRTRTILKPALEVLAGIPTVVYGYFALTAISPLLQDLGIPDGVFNALAAALVMGVMLIPTVASVSEDAMSAVPRDLRDGAYALGSNRAPGRRCASSCRPRSRGSSPRSCSRSRARWARR